MPQRREQLAVRRASLGFTQESLAGAIGVSPATVRRWERGSSRPNPRQRPKLADRLQVTLPELERILDGASTPPPNGHAVPAWLSHYASLEQGAARLQTFEPTTIPGLLQTADYAAAVIKSSWQELAPDIVAERVEVRIARQAVLDREPEPLELICVIDESALNRVTGGPEVMAAQLAQLVEISRRPTVQIRICPFTNTAVHTVPCGSFRLFTSAEREMPFMVCTEGLTGFNYLDGLTAIEAHAEVFEYLTTIALPPEQSAELIEARAEGYQ